MRAHHTILSVVLCLAVSITSGFPTAGVLSLLREPEDEIKIFALQRLDELVDDFWAEVADRITEL